MSTANMVQRSASQFLMVFCAIGMIGLGSPNPASAQSPARFPAPFNPVMGTVSADERPFRDEICLNGRWQFMPVFESPMEKFVKPTTFEWDSVPLKIPSPWNVNGFAKGGGGDFIAYPSYPEKWENATMGWMRREFVLPPDWMAKEVVLHFEAIAGVAEVYVNGTLAGKGLDIFLPTEFSLTSLLRPGTNEIIVGVAKAGLTDKAGKFGRRNYVAGSFWGQHIAGIWQDVYLCAYPRVYVQDVFIKPDVSKEELVVEVTIKNTTDTKVSVSPRALMRKWIPSKTKDMVAAPVERRMLEKKSVLDFSGAAASVEPHSTAVLTMRTQVRGELSPWTPETPNLYGAVVSIAQGGKQLDAKYERFGWREFTISGNKLLLNGTPLELRGDSWHFMGIPQMTRRYAWGWFSMLKDANANAVRLHAQPYPRFYLDVADEMGICVLDETGIWASDGGPKIDDEHYWTACGEHVRKLVLRDRNHPSVFGWSVCNETLPVAIEVLRAPKEIVQRQIDEINRWVDIVRSNDSTRGWISGDGETQAPTKLPTRIRHYANKDSMKEYSQMGIPWGVGENGMAYYGTPKQVAAFNGSRAYESQAGRMEGLAIEAYDTIASQRDLQAAYASVFNIVWYGLKPLELGLNDITRKPVLADGIYFNNQADGLPGVHPERIGPYTTTINPGYDPRLPMYQPWALFEAIKAAYATPRKSFSVPMPPPQSRPIVAPTLDAVVYIGDENSPVKKQLLDAGLRFVSADAGGASNLVVFAGDVAAIKPAQQQYVRDVMQKGGIVLVWALSPQGVAGINSFLSSPVTLKPRDASSCVKLVGDPFVGGLDNSDLYFTETSKTPMLTQVMASKSLKGKAIVAPCNTDWNRWNYVGEDIKTATTLRSEREEKPQGAAVAKFTQGPGVVYLSTLDLVALKGEGMALTRRIFSNLGVRLHAVAGGERNAFNADGRLVRALVLGPFLAPGKNEAELIDKKFIDEAGLRPEQNLCMKDGKIWEIFESGGDGAFDFSKMPAADSTGEGVVYLSFWVYSPRSLTSLLVEPDIPNLALNIEAKNGFAVYVNGRQIARSVQPTPYKLASISFEKGWNHVMLKVVKTSKNGNCRVWLESNKPEFVAQLGSCVDQSSPSGTQQQ